MFKKILSIIIRIIHVLYIIFSLIAPYIFNNIKILIFLVFLYILTISQWYLLNSCFLTEIEYKLLDEKTKKYEDGSNKNFIVLFLEKYLGINEKILYYFFTFIPIFNSIVCLIKIYFLYNNKCKKFKN